jgi:hypothetical protein
MTKYPVRSSHLALRFYQSDLWSAALIESCLIKGSLHFWEDSVRPDTSYWIPNVGSIFDIDALAEHVSEVHTFDGRTLAGDDMKEYMKGMNWI